MKYVAFDGGLGNQMFQYAFMQALKFKGNNVRMFIPHKKWEHKTGFELSRVFGIKEQLSFWEFLYNKVPYPFRKLFLLTHKTYNDVNFRFQSTALTSKDYDYFYGTWQSESYFVDIKEKIQEIFSFNSAMLSDYSLEVLKTIRSSYKVAVSVHVRRGDYLSAAFKEGFGSCCSLDYYKRAISSISDMLDCEILFVFFSDDMSWVKENIKVPNAIYVDGNYAENAWQDMYLMSQCNHNIIANSSFSWWAAWLNQNSEKKVFAPKRWWASLEDDDVVPESWIRL